MPASEMILTIFLSLLIRYSKCLSPLRLSSMMMPKKCVERMMGVGLLGWLLRDMVQSAR